MVMFIVLWIKLPWFTLSNPK